VADEARAAEEATAHLLDAGHQRIALIQRGERLWATGERLAGYRRALAAASLPYDPRLVVRHEPPEAPADALVQRLLALPDPPTAAYVAPNLVGLRLVAALLDAGVPVPERLALVVSADEDWMQVTRPRLSAIALPGRELGAAATRLLLDQLCGVATGATGETTATVGARRTVTLHAPLVVRESSRPDSLNPQATVETEATG
jgi:LacI family transcriptional regulator